MTNDAVTPADARTAAALPPSAHSPVRKHTTVFVDVFAAPAMQTLLRSLATDLRAFDGCGDVDGILAEALEGKALNAIADRLENSLARVAARIVEINASLGEASMALAHAQASAPDGSPVRRKLAALVATRTEARGTAKAARTFKRNQRAKKKAAGG